MSIIIDNRLHRTHASAVNISYDINQLDLSGAQLQVKFDTKIVGGVGSKFVIRHSNASYKWFSDEYVSPVMESSSEGSSHVFTVDISDELIEKSKFLTVTTNGASGTDKVDLEITNIEITTFGVRIPDDTQPGGDNTTADKMMRIAGRDDNGKARAIKVNEKGELQTGNRGVVVISSAQTKPIIAEMGEGLLEYDTGKVFFYDGAEWRELL